MRHWNWNVSETKLYSIARIGDETILSEYVWMSLHSFSTSIQSRGASKSIERIRFSFAFYQALSHQTKKNWFLLYSAVRKELYSNLRTLPVVRGHFVEAKSKTYYRSTQTADPWMVTRDVSALKSGALLGDTHLKCGNLWDQLLLYTTALRCWLLLVVSMWHEEICHFMLHKWWYFGM